MESSCPACGASLPAGAKCRRCLMRVALEESHASASPETAWTREVSLARRVVEARLASEERVTPALERVRQLLKEGSTPPPRLADLLWKEGAIDEDAYHRILALESGEPESPEPPEGDRFGKFLRQRLLGEGGMGQVWLARDTELGRQVALKFLKKGTSHQIARFQREARTAARLSHPNIAAIYEMGQAQEQPYIAMQYVEGKTLDALEAKGPRTIARLVRDAARAVAFAHKAGIIHRDLKPRNLMAVPEGKGWRVFVMDFGLARDVENVQASGAVVGSPPYMSPEQVRGEAADARADVYGLGATLYELLTGRIPFEGDTAFEILKKAESQEPARPRAIDPKIDPDLETIVLKCLEKDRNRRYAGATELADDLTRWLKGEAILAHPPSAGYRMRKALARRKLAVVAALAIASAASMAGWWWQAGRPELEYSRRYADGLRRWEEAGKAALARRADVVRPKVRESREQFTAAIAIRETEEALVMLGRCLQLEGRMEEAVEAFERALRAEPDPEDAPTDLAKALLLRFEANRGMPLILVVRGIQVSAAPQRLHVHQRNSGSAEAARARELLQRPSLSGMSRDLLEGLVALADGDHARAAGALGRYVENPQGAWDVSTMVLLGLCRLYAGDAEGAVATLNRALDICPDNPAAIKQRAMARDLKGDLHGAIEDHDRAIALDPRCGRSWHHRGMVRTRLGNLEEALADFTASIEREPAVAAAYMNRSLARARKGDRPGAVEDLTEALRLDPSLVGARANRANELWRLGRLEEALADCERAIREDPRFGFSYYVRGSIRHGLGDHAGALADARMAAELLPDEGEPLVLIGGVHAEQKYWTGAFEALDAAIALVPDLGHAHATRGMVKLMAGDTDGARTDLRRALELDPGEPIALRERARIRLSDGDHDGAAEDLTRAMERDPREARLFHFRGLVWGAKGDYARALEDFTQALTYRPSYVEALAYQALAFDYLGRKEEALTAYGRVLELDPRHARTYLNRGRLRAGRSDLQGARADYLKAIETTAPGSAERAEAELHLKHLENASRTR